MLLKVLPTLIIDLILILIYFYPLEIMASCMAMFYGSQSAQVNEEPVLKSSLNLVLTQHFRDEDPNPREVRAHLKVDPLELDIITFFQTLAPW